MQEMPKQASREYLQVTNLLTKNTFQFNMYLIKSNLNDREQLKLVLDTLYLIRLNKIVVTKLAQSI